MNKYLQIADKFMMSATYLLMLPFTLLAIFAVVNSGIIPAAFNGVSSIVTALAGIPEVVIPILVVWAFMYLHNKYINK